MPKRRPRGHGGPVTPPTPPPPPDPPAEPDPGEPIGYAAVAGVTGGDGGTVYNVTTFAQLRTALLASGTRQINVLGSAVLNGAGASFTVKNGNFTVDGSAYTGPGVKDYKIVFKCSNVKLLEMAWAPGEGSTSSQSGDRRAISFNGGNDGAVVDRIWIHKCSLRWGPDVVASFIDNVEDSTVSYCLIGPCLEESNIASSPNGYGFNVTTPGNSDPATIYPKRLTFYRNLYALNKQRNLKYEHAQGVDAVNNVVYDYGNQAPVRGNPRAANIIGNIFKKGPESPASTAAFEEDDNYAQYSASLYHDDNIGVTAAGGSFTPTWSAIDGGALRGTPYDGGPTDADHGPLSVATADATLFSEVVANAGRTYEDATDAAVKAHAIAGTSDGYYNGAGFSTPHPSW